MGAASRQSDGEKTGPGKGSAPSSRANLTGGSRKGIPNKSTALLKDAILQAATQAGGEEGLVGYLKKQAEETPASFLPLLGKVLPLQVTGENGGPLTVVIAKPDA